MAHMVETHDGWVLRDDWHTEDVEARLEDYWGFTLTEDECVKVLDLVCESFDANHGISWDSIDEAIRTLYGDRQKKKAISPIRMRDDLAEQGLAIPASRTFESYDTMVDVTYIEAEELEGADYGKDPANPDDHPFCYVQLKDGRSFYFVGVDLDFEPQGENK